jgi:hypothetical protein
LQKHQKLSYEAQQRHAEKAACSGGLFLCYASAQLPGSNSAPTMRTASGQVT